MMSSSTVGLGEARYRSLDTYSWGMKQLATGTGDCDGRV